MCVYKPHNNHVPFAWKLDSCKALKMAASSHSEMFCSRYLISYTVVVVCLVLSILSSRKNEESFDSVSPFTCSNAIGSIEKA